MHLSQRNKLRLGLCSGYFTAICIPILLDITKDLAKVDFAYIKFWLVLTLIVFLALEHVVRFLAKDSECQTGGSFLVTALGQPSLQECVVPHTEDIASAKNIDILSDSLKSFVDNEKNLIALKSFLGNGGNLRLLLINPFGSGPALTAAARKITRGMATQEEFASEIIHSVRRLSGFLTKEQICRSLRLYDYPAFYASYMFDDRAFVTIFTYGRGGSSPCFYVKGGIAHEDFLAGIRRGFSELWDSCSGGKVDQNFLEKMLGCKD